MDGIKNGLIMQDACNELAFFRFALAHANDLVWLCDIESDHLRVFGKELSLLGYNATEDNTSWPDWLSRIHPNDQQLVSHETSKLLKGEIDSLQQTYRLKSHHQWLAVKATSYIYQRDSDGKATSTFGYIDVIGNPKTEPHAKGNQSLHDSRTPLANADSIGKKYYQALKGTFHGIWDWNLQTGEFYINENIIEKLVTNRENWHPNFDFWQTFIHPDEQQKAANEIRQQLQSGENQLLSEYRIKSVNNHSTWLTFSGTIIDRDSNSTPLRATGTVTDITRQKEIEIALKQERQLAQITLESINEAVITTDRHGQIITLNPKAEKLLHTVKETATGLKLAQLCTLKDEQSGMDAQDPISLCLNADLSFNLSQLTLTSNNDTTAFIDCSVSPIHDANNELVGSVMVIRDVTYARQMSHEMEHRAQHDALTNLYNRHAFESALEKSTSTDDYEHILCYIDLDQFKIVNDTCGHIAGDELLRQLSAEFSKSIRKSDILARLGGDEFGILMQHCDIDRAFNIASNIKQTVADYTFHWEDKTFRLGTCIGLATIDKNTTPTLAMQHADAACFTAKELGRNRIHIYSPDDDEMALTKGQMGWVPRIQKALQEDHFELYAQAITSLQNEESIDSHFEVLIRLNEDGIIVPPGAFLPAAERYNLSSQLDKWVIENTLHTLKNFRHKVLNTDIFNINLSAASLNENGFLEFIQETFAFTKIQPKQICFEITETAAVTNLTAANKFITSLKKMGCKFALDDFGSGLSSFGYLKNFPVDYLKIDGSFVKDMANDPIDAAMVKSINEIGQIMGKKTVAEWVENHTIAMMLKDIGVDFAQGYYFSKPSPLNTLLMERCFNLSE